MVEFGIQYREPRLQDCLGLPYMKQILLHVRSKMIFFPTANSRSSKIENGHSQQTNIFTTTVGHWIWFWSFLCTHGDVSSHGIMGVNPTWRRKSRQLKMVSQTVASSSVTANSCVHCEKRYKAAFI